MTWINTMPSYLQAWERIVTFRSNGKITKWYGLQMRNWLLTIAVLNTSVTIVKVRRHRLTSA